MKRIQISDYFYLDELIDPQTYFVEVDNGKSKLESKLPILLDKLRVLGGKPLSVNTWWSYYEVNKDKKEVSIIIKEILQNESIKKHSGYRGSLVTVGAKFSAHRKGMGADLKGITPKELLQLVRDNAKELYNLGLRRVEDIKITPTWFHLDVWDKNKTKGIEVVDLKKVVEIININN